MPTSTTSPAPSRRRALLDAAGYVALMGLGMALMHHGFGLAYGDPRMVFVIGPVEVILTGWALAAARRQGGMAASGLGPPGRGWLPWAAPLAAVSAIGVTALALAVARAPEAPGRWPLLLGVAATTGLVGLSEELMFRGVLLRAAWREGGLFGAMLTSAVGFSLLHGVNVLGGSPPSSVATQLGFTFVFGLVFAPVAVRVGSIWPLALIHWGWDLTLIGHEALGTTAPAWLPAVMLPVMLGTGAAGWWSLRGARRQDLAAFEAANS